MKPGQTLDGQLLPRQCRHCGEPTLFIAELAPAEALAAVALGSGMCARHWSNFAQGYAQSYGLTLLREDEQLDSLSD